MLRNQDHFNDLSAELLEGIFDRTDLSAFPALSLTCYKFSLFMQPYFDKAKKNSLRFNLVDAELKSYSKPSTLAFRDEYGISTQYRTVSNKSEQKVKIFKLISEDPHSKLSQLLLRKMRLALGDNNFLNDIICYANIKTFLFLTDKYNITHFSFENYYHAIQWGNVEIMKFFIDKGISVNQNEIQDGFPYGHSPLSYAIRWNQPECAKLLLAKGASLNDPCVFNEKHGVMVYPTFYLIDTSELTEEMEQVLPINRQMIEANIRQYYADNSMEIDMKTNPCSIM